MEGIEGKQVTIFYDDGGNVSRKDGLLTSITSDSYILNNKILIPKQRVIRIELKDDR